MSLISVVVPVYKVETILHYCIESILAQTVEDFELLLINDGSPDNSGKVCDDYAKKDSRIKVIHKKNEGVSIARNTGIENANGKYIVFVDSDDYVNNDYLASFLSVLDKYPNAENIWCGFSKVKDHNKTIIDNVKYNDDKISLSNISEIMTLHEKWLDASPVNKLYKREVIITNNLRLEPKLSLGEDLLFNYHYLDVCSDKKIYVVNNCTYNYLRMENESLDNRFIPDMFEIYKYINKELYRYICKWKLDETQKKKFYNAVYYSYERCLRNTFNEANVSPKKKKYVLNNTILISKEFIQVLKRVDCRILFPLKLAYKTGNYRIVENVNKMISGLYKLIK